jgi:hypothetical protein
LVSRPVVDRRRVESAISFVSRPWIKHKSWSETY